MMRKIFINLLIICLLIPMIIPPVQIKAETLNDLYKDLEKLKKNKEENIKKKNLTQGQINKAKQDITSISIQIEEAELDIVRLEKEIVELNKEIKERDKEIKDVITFLQISKGESEYLEYIFKARDFTDFIYRIAITEQLSDYNDKLLTKMNLMIKQNENKKRELNELKQNLKDQQNSLTQKMRGLNRNLYDLNEANVDLKTEIDAMNKLIKAYESLGCKRYDNLNKCANIPLDSKFSRPTAHGKVTSNFGYRGKVLPGVDSYHRGIDIANGEGTPIYASANGRVAVLYPKQSCGGKMLFIHHIVNGNHYTTGYFHLLSTTVSVGQKVTRGQLIAYMGGGDSTRRRVVDGKVIGYDTCTTGAHLHFQLSRGHYLAPGGPSNWEAYKSTAVDPRNYISFPDVGVKW
jgi:murein DD-endopeptidase MepM/ murein hydrolase activator NlpD